jgi:hypothetical protein
MKIYTLCDPLPFYVPVSTYGFQVGGFNGLGFHQKTTCAGLIMARFTVYVMTTTGEI